MENFERSAEGNVGFIGLLCGAAYPYASGMDWTVLSV
jgi:hypothetical protein